MSDDYGLVEDNYGPFADKGYQDPTTSEQARKEVDSIFLSSLGHNGMTQAQTNRVNYLLTLFAELKHQEGEMEIRDAHDDKLATKKESPRASMLNEARDLVTGNRNAVYGPPNQDFQRTADMASAWGFQVDGQPLKSHHVAIFVDLIKTSRLKWTPEKRDSWVDKAGYAACGYECALIEKEEAEEVNRG